MTDGEISAALYTLRRNHQAPALPGRNGMIEGEGLALKIHLMMQSDESAALNVDAVPAADTEDDPDNDPGLCR